MKRFLILASILLLNFSRELDTTKVSWYGPGFEGKKTASGEIFNSKALTCASPTLKFNTLVEIVNPQNGKSITVRVNDRGPFQYVGTKLIPHKQRKFDLSKAAFDSISNPKKGVITIKYRIL